MGFIILAADSIDTSSLSGGAGWAGAGLLGAVLVWLLMVHLPAKDRQIATMLTDAALERATVFEAHALERDKMFVRFDTTLDKVVAASKETVERATNELRADSVILKSAIDGLAKSIEGMKS